MAGSTLSIVTPSYNQADFIEECIQSVHEQVYEDIEHVVVDGGSTDGTVELLERYETKYDLRWVSEPDEGQAAAINKGIRMAEGDWIGWQNSDDFYLPGAFEIFAETRHQHPDADVIYGDVVVVNKDGKNLRRLYQTRPSKLTHRYWSMFARNQGMFFARRVVDTVGNLDEDLEFAMDADYFWRVLQADLDLVNVPEALGAFRKQENAKTYNRTHEFWEHELREIYPQTFSDQIIPSSLLKASGMTIKGINLVRDGRWGALWSRS
jgi:glycosyltransferase involved in cell wall biosynthesis